MDKKLAERQAKLCLKNKNHKTQPMIKGFLRHYEPINSKLQHPQKNVYEFLSSIFSNTRIIFKFPHFYTIHSNLHHDKKTESVGFEHRHPRLWIGAGSKLPLMQGRSLFSPARKVNQIKDLPRVKQHIRSCNRYVFLLSKWQLEVNTIFASEVLLSQIKQFFIAFLLNFFISYKEIGLPVAATSHSVSDSRTAVFCLNAIATSWAFHFIFIKVCPYILPFKYWVLWMLKFKIAVIALLRIF